MKITTDGQPVWHTKNERPDYLPGIEDYEPMPRTTLHMSSRPNQPQHAASWFLETTFSRIGGLPTWIQSEAYPQCPECNQTMTFIAQLSVEDIEEYGEGIYYTFLCKECSVSGVSYQQS